MKLCSSLYLAAWALYAYAAPVDLLKRDEPLSVQLTAAGNSAVKVVVANNGDMALNLLSTGTLFDDKLPVERISMFANNSSTKVPFEGIRKVHLDADNLSTHDFLVLGAGDKKEFTIEAASLHDLSNGGSFDVFANGILHYANTNSTELVGHLEYNSNKLIITVNGTEAANHKSVAERADNPHDCESAYSSPLQTRTNADVGFTASMLRDLAKAQSNCQELASGAAAAARDGHPRLETFFHSSSSATRNELSARFSAVARECAKPSLNIYCQDRLNHCKGSLLAYYGARGFGITFCDSYWNKPPVVEGNCLAKDQGNILLHEMTHASEVYNPSTLDWAYEYWPSVELSSRKALNNADSHKLFANYIRWGC
ncbi:neutral protease 2-like protein [Alternaria rosae]|uniref:neutral protease 2-like protein n=1 Tax=Alternaria rosae TaxID=1187941 RepID=UPI001E8D2AA5|nr:neutral protease 2-like protein [Alternaria rosae]KAH6868159.1 neutral protease 2-like protein [Alternaria rosae]